MKAHRAADSALKAKTKGQDDGEQRNGSEDPRSIDLWSEIVWRIYISRRKGRNAKPRKTIPCICDILTEYCVLYCNTPCFLDTLYLPQFIALEFSQATLTVQKRYPSLSCQTRCRHDREKVCYTTRTPEARSSHSRRMGHHRERLSYCLLHTRGRLLRRTLRSSASQIMAINICVSTFCYLTNRLVNKPSFSNDSYRGKNEAIE